MWIPNKGQNKINAHERQRKRPDKISKKHAASLFELKIHAPARHGRKSPPQSRFDAQMINNTMNRTKRQETAENSAK